MISPATASSLRDRIDRETSGLNPAIAGISYLAVDWHGDLIFSHASGSIGLDIPGRPLTIDNTLLWLASCTKLITGIACMQLVEQGRLALDDVEQVENLAPELRDVKVLVEKEGTNEEFELVEKDRSITLRMLLTHTCKFCHSFNFEKESHLG
jgi:CubicO group peptidase (beta-lactamase class C family)